MVFILSLSPLEWVAVNLEFESTIWLNTPEIFMSSSICYIHIIRTQGVFYELIQFGGLKIKPERSVLGKGIEVINEGWSIEAVFITVYEPYYLVSVFN